MLGPPEKSLLRHCMRHTERTFFRFRAFDVRTLDSLCHDTLHFALPSGFNDPLDSRPTLTCDSSREELRLLLGHLVRTRAKAEVGESLARLRLKGERASQYAIKTAEDQASRALADIAYHATNPEYEEGPEQVEGWLLTREAERELLRHYERGVCCFSSDYKSPLLWSHYGDQHRGLCIGYKVRRRPQPRMQRVAYGGDRSIKTSLVVDALLHNKKRSKAQLDKDVLLRKARDWSYEHEWRLIGKTGVQESPLLLTEVIFGLRCPDAVKYSVVRAIAGSSRPVDFHQICETKDRYALDKESIDVERLDMHFPHVATSAEEMGFPLVSECRRTPARKKKRRAGAA